VTGRHGDGRSDQLIGTAVHRLLQRFGFDASIEAAAVRGMLRSDEMADEDPAACIDTALAAYRSLCVHPDVRALYDSGERLHEVPFTLREQGRFVRGSIDCLVRTAPDRLTVLEFKTGRPRDEHRAQLELYRAAAARLFPGCTVDARLVYASEVVLS
jgi:ATP-dependent exoDNAse (exonuclease V) beta subunit